MYSVMYRLMYSVMYSAVQIDNKYRKTNRQTHTHRDSYSVRQTDRLTYLNLFSVITRTDHESPSDI